MKKMVMGLMILMTSQATLANGQDGQSTKFCGTFLGPEALLSNGQFQLMEFDNGDYVYKTFTPANETVKFFIDSVYVHGGRLCREDVPSEAPATLCVEGELDKGIVNKVQCKPIEICVGFACSGLQQGN